MLGELADELLARPRVMVTDWAYFRGEALPAMDRALVGRMAFTDLSGGKSTRYVDVLDWPYTTAELVPIYLRRAMREAGRRSAMRASTEARWLDLPTPLHFAGPVTGRLAYVDLRRAYHAIYSRIGCYDPIVTVTPERVRVRQGDVALPTVEAWGPHAVARNSLVGIARMRGWGEYRRGHYQRMRGTGRLTSPSLWRVIAMVLSAIAAEMMEAGAVYVHTDGYILPEDRAAAAVAHLADRWGLEARVKAAGDGAVTGLGSWQIDGRGADRLRAGRPRTSLVPLTPGQRDSLAGILAGA